MPSVSFIAGYLSAAVFSASLNMRQVIKRPIQTCRQATGRPHIHIAPLVILTSSHRSRWSGRTGGHLTLYGFSCMKSPIPDPCPRSPVKGGENCKLFFAQASAVFCHPHPPFRLAMTPSSSGGLAKFPAWASVGAKPFPAHPLFSLTAENVASVDCICMWWSYSCTNIYQSTTAPPSESGRAA